MADERDTGKGFGVCFENTPCAEMMRKMTDQQGVGSLCAEMMKKIAGHQADGCGFDCAEIVRTMTAGHGEAQEDPEKNKE